MRFEIIQKTDDVSQIEALGVMVFQEENYEKARQMFDELNDIVEKYNK